jgi:sec-independent protein translocase protein TatC
MNTPPSPIESKEMPFFEHLGELRKRLLYSLLILTLGSVLTYAFSDTLFAVLTKPHFDAFPGNTLIGTGPAEAFVLKLKVALFAALLLTCPLHFLQLWLFIAPGLYNEERRLVIPFLVITTGLFLLGAYLCYELILPFTFSFFRDQYVSIGLTPQIRISEHLSLMMFALLGFGAIFETPVLAYFLARAGLVTHRTLLNGWRYAIVAIFIIAAILTPTPDILTMTLFAIPLLILYGISILVVRWVVLKNAERSLPTT